MLDFFWKWIEERWAESTANGIKKGIERAAGQLGVEDRKPEALSHQSNGRRRKVEAEGGAK